MLIQNVVPIGFPDMTPQPLDIVLAEGRVVSTSPTGHAAAADARIIDGDGAFLSPGWIDLHAHVWHGGTDISIRPSLAGLARGVTTIVDAGSAGEANFAGFREFIIEPAPERILAFLNVGSIGLVACNRVSELPDHRAIDFDRIAAVIAANRDIIIGLKVRASHTITGSWGITPVRLAKKLARIHRLPLMVHVGEPPPLYDEVLEVLDPGDIVTHCFNGKPGSSIVEDETLFALVESCAAKGVLLDVGHGGASFSMKVAAAAIARGLLPNTISTDLHLRSIHRPVWDLATTMSKLLAAGMPFERVIAAVTAVPAAILRQPEARLEPGAPSNFTLFTRGATPSLNVIDSNGDRATLSDIIDPRFAILGETVVPASRYVPASVACPHCGTALPGFSCT